MGKIIGLTFESETNTFPCPYCPKEYKTEEGLAKHMAEKHPE